MIPTGTINGFPTTGFPGFFTNPFNGVNPGFTPGFTPGFNPGGWNSNPFGFNASPISGFNGFGGFTPGFTPGFVGGAIGNSPWNSIPGAYPINSFPGYSPINSFPGFNGFNPGWNTTPFGINGNGFNGGFTGGFTGGSPLNWTSIAGWNGGPINTNPFNGFNPGFQGFPFGAFPTPFGAYPGFNPGVCPTGYPSNGYTNTTGVNTNTGFTNANPYSPFTGNTGIGATCSHAA